MEKTVFSNCTYIDIENQKVVPKQAIVINNSHIEYVGDLCNLSPLFLMNSITYDLNGKYVLPGFIDAHVHIFEEPDSRLYQDFSITEDLDIALDRAINHLETMLYSGITAVREMGTIDRRNILLKNYINNSDQKPELVVCGNPITHSDGHFVSRCRIVDTDSQMKQAVEDEINAGADFIKINNTIRVGMPQHVIETAVKLATQLGKFVACHAYTYDAMKAAINSGVRSLEHVAEFDDQLLEEMREKDIIPIPTFVAAFDSIPSVNPDAKLEILSQTIPDAKLSDFVEWYNWQVKNLPNLFKFGIEFGLGTDAGFVPTTFDSIHREMCLLVKLGATPWQVLKAATIGSAKALGKEKNIGKIARGMQADIVILNEDPIINIKNTKNIYGTVLRGKLFRK